MSTLIEKIEKLIKREKTTPERKKDDSKKSSNEILSELFGVFNADPPKIDEVSVKKKKSKKKHKKKEKKRSRSSSSESDTDDSEYSHKRKKRKKNKTKKRRRTRSPSITGSLTPVIIKPEPNVVKVKNEPVAKKSTTNKINGEIKIERNEPVEKKICNNKIIKEIKSERDENKKQYVKVEDTEPSTPPKTPETSRIPSPESPKEPALEPNVNKVDNKKQEVSVENDKTKSKIQIKNLKFSIIFEETVKKAEEEARRKAEKYEEGEYTDSSSSSVKEIVINSQFPKTSDPSGMLKQQSLEEVKLNNEEKSVSSKTKHSDSSHKSSSSRRHRSRSHKRSKSKSRRSRSKSTSRKHRSRRHSRSRSRHRSRSRRRSRSRTRHRSRHYSPRHRSRRSRSRSSSGVKLADSEKKRLLEVARRNAINMLKNGAVPAGAAVLPPHTRNQVMAAIQSGGKSVDELTDFCKHLSKKEALGELSSVSSNDDNMSENEDTIAFHHPFLVKEKAPIIMSIRGGAPMPVKSTALQVINKEELRIQFPVSSGSQHREKASEWTPVSPKKDMQIANLNPLPPPAPISDSESTPPRPASGPLAILPPPATTASTYIKNFTSSSQLSSVSELPALPAPGPQVYPPGIESTKMDMAALVTQKLSLIRKEQEESELSNSSSTFSYGWTKDSSLGQFTGTTGAHILTPKELASGTQAWAKKDQLQRAAPVESGMGMHLLQKMGWTPGQGLGKEGTGTLQPLLLEVKLDTRGLQAKEEYSGRYNKGMKQPRGGGRMRGSVPLVAGGKHPVSLLGEYCSKQKLGPPEYSLCFECGPDHKKNFLFKVNVAGIEYQPAVASANKKQAKADAAQLALQKLGILM